MVNKYILTVVMCIAMNLLVGAVVSASSGPLDQIKGSVHEIIDILKDDKYKEASKEDERRKLIFNAVGKRFNFPLMAKLALGQTWNKISSEEQDEFNRLFTDLLKKTYIRRIESYTDEAVVFQKEVISKNLAVVYSLFVKNNTQLSVIYKLRQEAGNGWMVYDVVIEGGSIVKQYRRQFAEIMKKEDFNGLIIRLERKMDSVEKKS